jgi:hypothetical protein
MKIVFTPDWFLNFDVTVGIFGFIILMTFFFFSVKAYNISKKESVFYLGLGFFLISLAEISAVLTKVVLFFDTETIQEIGKAIVESNLLNTVDIFYYLGFFSYRLFTLLGLYIIYKLPTGRKKSDPADFALTLYLILMTAILSHSLYYFYHLTAFILLFLIIRDYTRIYYESKLSNTLILISAFSLLAISQLIFIFSLVGVVYVLAQSLQVVGYMILLLLIVRIIQNGKKKKPNGNHA